MWCPGGSFTFFCMLSVYLLILVTLIGDSLFIHYLNLRSKFRPSLQYVTNGLISQKWQCKGKFLELSRIPQGQSYLVDIICDDKYGNKIFVCDSKTKMAHSAENKNTTASSVETISQVGLITVTIKQIRVEQSALLSILADLWLLLKPWTTNKLLVYN